MIRNYQIHIAGKVQGVWFRKYTYQEAIKLQLTGYVRNEPGGGVYVEAEGEENQLILLLRFLEQGSPMSKVSSVSHKEASLKNFGTFIVSR